jgi:hypothetical protein
VIAKPVDCSTTTAANVQSVKTATSAVEKVSMNR